jgi:ribonucleoside-diphosphate reductase alpha chain
MQYQQVQRAESAREPKLRKKTRRGNTPRTVLARERLPNRRASETFNFEVEGLRYCATVSRFADGRLGEIFVGNHRVGSQSDTNVRDAALAASLALQHGCTLGVLRGALLRDMRGRATTPLGVALDLVAEWGECENSAIGRT